MSGRAKRKGRKATRRAGARGKKARGPHAQRLTAEDMLEKVEACLDAFQYEEAVEWCVRAVEREPDSARVLEEAGPVLLELGHTDRALECLKRAAELQPSEGHVKFLYLGQLHSGEKAVAYLTTAISIMRAEREKAAVSVEGACGVGVSVEGACGAGVSVEDISSAYCSLAEIFLTDSCFSSEAEERCQESCRQAVQFGPGNPEAHQLLASCLLSMGRDVEAKAAIQKSLSLWLQGSVDTREGCKGEGREDGEGVMSEGVMGDDGDLPPYFSRVSCAKILMELHLHDEARCVLERLLKDDDEVVLVWYLMGWLHTLTSDVDSAHFYLEQASKLAVKSSCDDHQMVAHISELLQELSGSRELTSKGGEGAGDREGEEEGEGDREEEGEGSIDPNMDTT